ncbi:hypothetical protein ACEPAI_8738 [Sanghuangporus weigelae]
MTPDTKTATQAQVQVNLLKDPHIKFVRVTWVDLVNFVRYRVVPIAHFRNLFVDAVSQSSSSSSVSNEARVKGKDGTRFNPHPGITITKVTLGLAYLAMAEGFSATGEYVYTPDLTSTRLLPYAPGHANVFGWFEEKQVEADDVKVKANENEFEVSLCPRTVLRRIVQDAFKAEGVSFLVGFETEVIFLSSIDPLVATNDYGWSESPAICAGTPEARALEEIAEALEEAGIELQMYHAEAAPGQYEIVTGPLPPLEACDALITTREIIMNVSSKHGMRATLAPRVYDNSCGSAAHTHISLTSTSTFWSSTESQPVRVSSPPSVSLAPLEQSFLSGLLAHLPAATAFTLPTRASYARMTDGVWSGGTWASWGRDNRETPVRLAGRGPSYNFEIKSIDGTSNPYLAISALLSAGLAGISARTKLTSVGLHVPANTLTDVERKEFGVENRMPLSIDEARKALAKDEVMKKTLGEELVRTYLNVNKTLDEQLKAPTPEEEMIKLIKTF